MFIAAKDKLFGLVAQNIATAQNATPKIIIEDEQ